MTILETAHLRIREFRDDDLEDIFRMMSDPDIMRYIRAPDSERDVVRERMVNWAKYHAEHPKLGVFVLENREDSRFAGYCVIRHVDFTPGNDLEVGYALAPEYTGKGLATEAAAGMTDYLYREMQAEKVVAFTDPANVASQRVLEKCGFQRAGTRKIYDGESVVFEHYK
ncbi:MAG: GNAT family N-acetyltransferase [Saprospiraceae bacterium]